nr:hypothetical protein [Tanacetum cinerariifolium]
MRHEFDLGYKTWVHHGDIGETSNEPNQATHNDFEELYASANEELYPGSDYVTRLDFMTKFTYFKVKGKLTYSIFNEMLEFFQNVFPISKGYKLPPSYYAIKKTFKMIELGYESIHACEHDCCLFQGDDNKDLDFCLVCNTSRWKDSNTPRKKVPKKYLDFAKEPRNVRLGLAADGFNPFGNLSQAYIMWPVILMTYNLPPWLCMKESSFMLKMLISGPKSQGKDIDVYLRPLIEDLKTINDFPAQSSLSGWSGQGYKACPTCNKDTPSVRVLSKTAYVDHIRFLKNPYKWRSLREFNGQTDNKDPPKEFSRDKILAQLDRLPTRLTEALEGGPICPRWMFLFERYMKKLKGYVRNKAKPEGSIAVGYVAEEALTFSSYYFRDVTTKFNHPEFIQFDAQELKKVKWYVLHNNPEIDTYRSQFKSLFPNKDMKEEFPDRFRSQIRQRHVDNDKDPEVSTTSEFFTLACGPTWTPISINSCVVDSVRYVVHSRGERGITQNNGICSPGPEEEMYYEDDPDIIHFDNSSDLPLSTRLNDLDNATLHIDGQSTEVDVLPDIIDVVDEDDDITDDEEALPHDLADSDNEDLINVDDDGVDKMLADVARSYGGDGGGKGKQKPNLGERAAGRLNTRDKTQNLSLKEITDTKGPFLIQFELRDKQTVMPLDDHAAHWSNYIEEVIRGVPLYYPSWLKVLKERKAALITDIGTQFNLRPHMESLDWTEINAGIQQHLNIARAAQNWKNQAKSTVISRQGSRLLARLRDEMRQSSTTQEYVLLIDTFFVAHTVNGEFLWDEDRRIYEEMRRLEATSTYTDDEINRLDRGGKQQGYILGVGMVLPARAITSPSTPAHESTLNSLHKKVDFMMSLFKSDSKYSDMFSQFESGGASGSGGCGDDEEGADHQDDEDEDGDGDT